MSELWRLSALATRGVVFGACQAVGVGAGDMALEPVSRFLVDRFVNQGARLVHALHRANDQAWHTLEFALAGESLWQRCSAVFSRADDRAFREQVRGFLDSLPADLIAIPDPEFRRLALAELRLARREGALAVSTLDVRQIAHHAGRFACYASPEQILIAEREALVDIAESFPGDRYANLRRLLGLTAADGTSLLAAAARYFLRREIEEDEELFRGLAFRLLERGQEGLETGLAHVRLLLANNADRADRLLTDVVELASRTHDEVLKLGMRLDQLLEQHRIAGRELRPDDTLLSISDEERRLVRELVGRYRSLSEQERGARVELAFRVGQVEAIVGDFAEAKKEFLHAARLADDPTRQALAHVSAYQAALAAGDLDGALSPLIEAARLDSQAHAPFPLDKYRPERILGAGGFGTAFLCRHAFKRDVVVVKALRPAGLDRGIDEIFTEAQVLAGLNHPAIVQVVDCDFADRVKRAHPYVVMEYFAGQNLAEHVARHGTFRPDDFLDLARQIARGLHAAHERGLLHRDVKPANLLVRGGADGWEVKIIDFGLAVRPAWLAVTRAGSEQARRTRLGASLAGTWKYAAPEQLGELHGTVVRAASDIYAFGRTAYLALLGTPEPDDEDREQLPAPWRKLLSRCTARLPERRPQSFAEVLDELERSTLPRPDLELSFLELVDSVLPVKPAKKISPPKVTPPPPPPCSVKPARPARPVTPARASEVRAACVSTLAAHEGTVSAVAFRPDGRILATGGFDDTARLWSFPSGQPLLTLKDHAADVNGLAFCRDGTLIATASDDRDVRLWNVPGGQAGPVLRHPDRVYAVSFNPDGKILATGCDDFKVRLWSPESGTSLGVLTGHTSFVRHVAFSPDGKILATASGDRLVHLWNVADRTRRSPLIGHAHTVWGVAFSPDGRLLATTSQDRTAKVWQVATGQLLHTLNGHEEIVWNVAFSPDGRMLATASHDRTVRLWSAHTGKQLASLSGHGGLVRSLTFSPDGRYLATAGGDGAVRVWLLADEIEPCDWAGSVPELPPRARLTLTRAGHGIVYPGDEAWVNVTVENTGRGDLVQLRAVMESASPYLRGLHVLFGRIRPGEKVSRCVGSLLPADLPPGELTGDLVFQEGNDYQPAPARVDFSVRPLPRDDFQVRYTLVDDGSGNSFGDGDGVPQRGECLDVVVSVTNDTGGTLDGLQLILTAQEVPTGVVVNVPRTELPPVPDGGRAEGRVTFSIKPSGEAGPASFELRVEATDGRLFARVPVRTLIE